MSTTTPHRTTAPSVRQARSQETRARIVASGREAFARLGHDAVNLADDVLRPAGVSVGSFYHQFADKTELLVAILRESADDRRSMILDGAAGADLAVAVETALRRLFDSLDRDETSWRLQLDARASANSQVRRLGMEGRERWISLLGDHLAGWGHTTATERRQAATLLVGFSTGLALVYLDMPPAARRRQRRTLVEGAIAFALPGVGNVLGVPINTPHCTEDP
jgi:AcrR family transcriptional regulator